MARARRKARRKTRHAGHKTLARKVSALGRRVTTLGKRVTRVEKKVSRAGTVRRAYGHPRKKARKGRKSASAYRGASRCLIAGPGHNRGSHVQCIGRDGRFVGTRGPHGHGLPKRMHPKRRRRAHAYAD